jgi:predicted transcriptional regulator
LPGVVAELEQIRDNLISPVLVYPKLHREVQSFQSEVSLSEVLKSIYEKGYSQFPIYQEGEYVGLLTENGITRWLASHNAKVMTLIEFEDVPIKDVLSNEEQRKNCRFIRRDTPLPEAENHFVQHATLEALLITDKGNASENLLGIITRWDILEL